MCYWGLVAVHQLNMHSIASLQCWVMQGGCSSKRLKLLCEVIEAEHSAAAENAVAQRSCVGA